MAIELGYLSIGLPSRDNVREPIKPPEMRLVRTSTKTAGSIVTVPLTERQLLAIIKDCTNTLDRMYLSRRATQPGDGGNDG